jgi:hypothetical protein
VKNARPPNKNCFPVFSKGREAGRKIMLNPQTLAPGKEQHEMFATPGRMGKPGKERCQYDYRHRDGELFSCVAASPGEAREKRNEWLQKRSLLLTDAQYALAREKGSYLCPLCGGSKVDELEPLEWESPTLCEETASVSLTCKDCNANWREFLRPVGFNLE